MKIANTPYEILWGDSFFTAMLKLNVEYTNALELDYGVSFSDARIHGIIPDMICSEFFIRYLVNIFF